MLLTNTKRKEFVEIGGRRNIYFYSYLFTAIPSTDTLYSDSV